MKIWSIITFLFFFNFTALPSVAAVLGWELMGTNVVVNEEETHSSSSAYSINEKTLPNTFSVFDYLKFTEVGHQNHILVQHRDSLHLSPLLTIFSPPPEVLA